MELNYVGNSGGETSAYMTKLLIDKGIIDSSNSLISFQNTGEEHPLTYKFLEDQMEYWDIPIVWLEYDYPMGFLETFVKRDPTYENLERYGWEGMYNMDIIDQISWREEETKMKLKPKDLQNLLLFSEENEEDVYDMVNDYTPTLNRFYKEMGRKRTTLSEGRFKVVTPQTANKEGQPFLDILMYKNAVRACKKLPWVVPSAAQRFSTGDMKVRVSDNYTSQNYEFSLLTKYLGIRADEPSRYEKSKKNETKKVKIEMPLLDWGVTSEDVATFWDNQEFELGIRDKKYLGNCLHCYLKTDLKRILSCMDDDASFKRLQIIEEASGDCMKRKQQASHILSEATTGKYSDKDLKKDKDTGIGCFCG